MLSQPLAPARNNQKEIFMKKIILAAAISTLVSGAAFAQTTGPAGQQDTNKPGMANPSTEMNKGSTPGGMTNGTTTGMSKDGIAKDGMKNDGMAKDGMAKGGMKKDGMSK
jgi:pentapeptide MXKDX repeat protein